MSLFRRWGLPALMVCLPALALPSAAARAADENPAAVDSKAVDALVHKTLREVINEGADMYNAQGKYANMERDFSGCYRLYEGALMATKPLLAAHPDLQKAIDDGLAAAQATPQSERRAFVLRTVIDKIRDAVNPNPTAVAPPTPPPGKETTASGKAVGAEKGKVTLSVGGETKSFTVPESAKIIIDDKEGKLEDIKKDSTVTITSKGEAVTKVEVKSAAVPPPPPPAKETKTTGKVTKIDKDTLVLKDDEGKGKNIIVPETAKVTIDGKDAVLQEVKEGSAVTVTTKDDEVTKVEVKGPAAPPPPPPPAKETKTTGKVVTAEKDTLTLKDDEGKSKSFKIDQATVVTIDGKEGILDDVKKDSAVTVTSKGDEVSKVEVKGPTAPPPPPPPPAEAKTLWDRLGGEVNVAKVVDDFVNTAGKDPKVNFWRDPTKTPSKEEVATLKSHLIQFVSSVAGGPLKYEGKDMKAVHKGMKISNDEFDASVADLKDALVKNGAKADDVKAVLAVVQTTRKDIVEEKKPDETPKPPLDKDKPLPPDKDKPLPPPDKDKPLPPPPDKDKPLPPPDKDKPLPPPDKDKPLPPPDKDKPPPLDKDKPAPPPPDKDKPPAAESGHVSGTVTYKGKPASGNTIGLIGKDVKYVEVIGPDGTYKFKEDFKPGVYAVYVGEHPDKPNPDAVKVPAKYKDPEKSGLTAEVKKGEQTLDLDLVD